MEHLVVLTGVTGFLGKVVLEELLRCRARFQISRVVVLIRAQSSEAARHRFETEVAASICFSELEKRWTDRVEVVASDLSRPACGIQEDIYHQLCQRATHFIHCAGCVEFDATIEKILADNVTSALNALKLAQACTRLQRFVHTSTAYVQPHQFNPMHEVLGSLPLPAQQLFDRLLEGDLTASDALHMTGHPNLYLLAKSLAEHLLVQAGGGTPMTIVRPSIISVSWQHPFPGWVDSFAAITGVVAGIGTGVLRVLSSDAEVILDVVPVDNVAMCLIQESFASSRIGDGLDEPKIVHAVSTLKKGFSVNSARAIIIDYFRRNYISHKKPRLYLTGCTTSLEFRFRDFIHQRLPLALSSIVARASNRNAVFLKYLRRARRIQQNTNRNFQFFANRAYDFRQRRPVLGTDFAPADYITRICRGVHFYLLNKDVTRSTFCGEGATSGQVGLVRTVKWGLKQPAGDLPAVIAMVILRQLFALIFRKVTVNMQSFAAATQDIEKEMRIVIVPTHRSYLDAPLCSYLFFTRPELGLCLPRVMASHEFASIPVIGWLCRRFRTIYVTRGAGRDPGLNAQLNQLAEDHGSLMFFIEGQRSRTGQVSRPKTGALRGLKATSRDFIILPVSITYDCVPEYKTLTGELEGKSRQTATFNGLCKWLIMVKRGQVDLGSAHITCGDPITLKTTTDVEQLSLEIARSLQAGSVATERQLYMFIHDKWPLGDGPDLEWIKSEIQQRGGTVFLDEIDQCQSPSADSFDQCSRMCWDYLFFKDLRAYQPKNPALMLYVSQHEFGRLNDSSATQIKCAALTKLLKALFSPICDDFIRAASALKAKLQPELAAGMVAQQIHCGPGSTYADVALLAFLRSKGDVTLGAVDDFIQRSAWRDDAENTSLEKMMVARSKRVGKQN
ncbi:hypothetical protein QQS21_010336 [Conoideocrella luteorostrata]|uniref:Fatty acyl-CoA reductase n=1 Tax=Conoideocrella luteorostrata TaxID=1105319 RepID=A0AAJ0CHY6_9HYPO|nr:hypothetical protein QQS21_010336 [Conoideocrella luteorostrata]